MTPRLRRSGGNLGRKSRNSFITKSGQTIKINRSIFDRFRSSRAARADKKASRLAGMPKGRLQRTIYRLHPKRLYKYWFSREGAIMALKLFGISSLATFLLIIGIFAYFRKDLPNITDFSGTNIGGSIQYYDKTGQTLLWEDFDAVKRIPVPGDKISDNIKKATVAIEDKDFFKHGGFDVRAIMRAGINNVFGGTGTTQGGSTITQQLVKLTQDWTEDRTYSRKAKELILAVELEREYNKDQILTGYLNVAPYGNIEYGVEAAANDYFHKSAKDLTIEESAFLAAIPKSPSIYSPYGPYFDREALVGRQHYIIDQMVDQGMITEDDAKKAKEVDVVAQVKPQEPKYAGIKAPYFALAAKDEVDSRFGTTSANRGGWKVITTLDMELQQIAEETVKNNVSNLKRYGANEAAFVAEDVKTGQIVTLVGGVDFEDPEHGKINYAHDAYIPPGSTFKPFDYAALIEYSDNAGAGSVLYDTKGPLPGYPCTDKGRPPPKGTGNCLQDYDFREPGPVTLRYALGGSRNIPAVKANLIAGTDKTIEMASNMMANQEHKQAGRLSYNCFEPGADLSPSADQSKLFSQRTPCYGASAIGDGAFLHLDDHVNGFATFARLGEAIPRTYILKITDASNKSLYEFKQPKGEQVIRPDTAYIINDMATDQKASYMNASYRFHKHKDWNFSIKTGTTNNGFDGLMASWSPKYAVVTWVGHHTRNKTLGGFMEYMTAPITRSWMQKAHDKAGPAIQFERPAGVKEDKAYVITAHVGLASVEPSRSTDLYPSWYKPPAGATSSNQKIDIISNKIATECTPARAIQTSNTSSANIFSVDTFVDKKAGSASEKDDVHKCTDAKPTITLAMDNVNCGTGCTISATITQGTHPLSSDGRVGTANLIVGDTVVQSVSVGGPGVIDFSYTPDWNGTRSLKVEIIDSVLYDGSDSGNITGSIAAVGPTAAGPGNGAVLSKNSVIFSWSGGQPKYQVHATCLDDSPKGNINSTSYDPPNGDLDTGSCTWWVKDENDLESAHITFTVIP